MFRRNDATDAIDQGTPAQNVTIRACKGDADLILSFLRREKDVFK